VTLPDAATRSGFRVIESGLSCMEIAGTGDLSELLSLCRRSVRRRRWLSCFVVIVREGKKRMGYAVGMAGVQISELPPTAKANHRPPVASSGRCGVRAMSSMKGTRWQARVWIGPECGYKILGRYDSIELAARAREEYLSIHDRELKPA
jgi:hypothetical protein